MAAAEAKAEEGDTPREQDPHHQHQKEEEKERRRRHALPQGLRQLLKAESTARAADALGMSADSAT